MVKFDCSDYRLYMNEITICLTLLFENQRVKDGGVDLDACILHCVAAWIYAVMQKKGLKKFMVFNNQ